MKYKDKALKFRERTYEAQGLVQVPGGWNRIRPIKWRNMEEFDAYLEAFGGRVKKDKRRRKGYLVAPVQTDCVVEVPMEFAEKVLAFGFP